MATDKNKTTVTIPISAKFGGKDLDLGDVQCEVKIVGTRVKAPTAKEIKQALRGIR